MGQGANVGKRARFIIAGAVIVAVAIIIKAMPLVIIGLVVGGVSLFIPRERTI